jgi:hypothetical protein
VIISKPTTARPQRRYDHRLRNLVQRTADVTFATDLGVPRFTARRWMGTAPTVVICLDVADLSEPELRQEVLKLQRRVMPTALLRLALALLRSSGFPACSSPQRPGVAHGRPFRGQPMRMMIRRSQIAFVMDGSPISASHAVGLVRRHK